MVALLLDNGWGPQSALCWSMPPTSRQARPLSGSFLTRPGRASWTSMFLQRASGHCCGGGAEHGVDMYSVRKLHQQLASQPMGNRMAEVPSLVATGGSWPRARRVDATGAKALGRSRPCPRCGEAEET
eukprot:4652779-Pyramimonas_sp.AAC.1